MRGRPAIEDDRRELRLQWSLVAVALCGAGCGRPAPPPPLFGFTPTPIATEDTEAPAPSASSVALPEIRDSTPVVTPGIPAEIVKQVIRRGFDQLRACYASGLSPSPNLTGRITVRFVIDADGRVAGAESAAKAVPNEAVVTCVLDVFRGLIFPQPEGGSITVIYPVDFSPPEP